MSSKMVEYLQRFDPRKFYINAIDHHVLQKRCQPHQCGCLKAHNGIHDAPHGETTVGGGRYAECEFGCTAPACRFKAEPHFDLRQLLQRMHGAGQLKAAVLTTYSLDLRWLMEACPFFFRASEKVPLLLLHGDRDKEMSRYSLEQVREHALSKLAIILQDGDVRRTSQKEHESPCGPISSMKKEEKEGEENIRIVLRILEDCHDTYPRYEFIVVRDVVRERIYHMLRWRSAKERQRKDKHPIDETSATKCGESFLREEILLGREHAEAASSTLSSESYDADPSQSDAGPTSSTDGEGDDISLHVEMKDEIGSQKYEDEDMTDVEGDLELEYLTGDSMEVDVECPRLQTDDTAILDFILEGLMMDYRHSVVDEHLDIPNDHGMTSVVRDHQRTAGKVNGHDSTRSDRTQQADLSLDFFLTVVPFADEALRIERVNPSLACGTNTMGVHHGKLSLLFTEESMVTCVSTANIGRNCLLELSWIQNFPFAHMRLKSDSIVDGNADSKATMFRQTLANYIYAIHRSMVNENQNSVVEWWIRRQFNVRNSAELFRRVDFRGVFPILISTAPGKFRINEMGSSLKSSNARVVTGSSIIEKGKEKRKLFMTPEVLISRKPRGQVGPSLSASPGPKQGSQTEQSNVGKRRRREESHKEEELHSVSEAVAANFQSQEDIHVEKYGQWKMMEILKFVKPRLPREPRPSDGLWLQPTSISSKMSEKNLGFISVNYGSTTDDFRVIWPSSEYIRQCKQTTGIGGACFLTPFHFHDLGVGIFDKMYQLSPVSHFKGISPHLKTYFRVYEDAADRRDLYQGPPKNDRNFDQECNYQGWRGINSSQQREDERGHRSHGPSALQGSKCTQDKVGEECCDGTFVTAEDRRTTDQCCEIRKRSGQDESLRCNSHSTPPFKSTSETLQKPTSRRKSLESESKPKELAWILVTSACLSNGAQGVIEDEYLVFRNFEIGVLFHADEKLKLMVGGSCTLGDECCTQKMSLSAGPLLEGSPKAQAASVGSMDQSKFSLSQIDETNWTHEECKDEQEVSITEQREELWLPLPLSFPVPRYEAGSKIGPFFHDQRGMNHFDFPWNWQIPDGGQIPEPRTFDCKKERRENYESLGTPTQGGAEGVADTSAIVKGENLDQRVTERTITSRPRGSAHAVERTNTKSSTVNSESCIVNIENTKQRNLREGAQNWSTTRATTSNVNSDKEAKFADIMRLVESHFLCTSCGNCHSPPHSPKALVE